VQELSIKEKKRKATEMVAVQMRQDNAIDVAVLDAARVQRHRSRCAAVDQERRLDGFQHEARVETTARAESIAASDDGYAHVKRLRSVAPRLRHAIDARCAGPPARPVSPA